MSYMNFVMALLSIESLWLSGKIEMQNQKVWGSITPRKSGFILCPTQVTGYE